MRRPTLVWLYPVLFAVSACASVVAFDPAGLVDSGIGSGPGLVGQGGDPLGMGGVDSNGGVPVRMGSGGTTRGSGGAPVGAGGSMGTGWRGSGGATGSGGQFLQPTGKGGASAAG